MIADADVDEVTLSPEAIAAVEDVLRAFAKALRAATSVDTRAAGALPSTKGAL